MKPAIPGEVVAKASKKAKKKVAAKKSATPKRSAKKAAAKGNGAISKAKKIAAPDTEQAQVELFQKAMESFRAADFPGAVSLFEVVEKGPDGAMRHRAKVHIRICRQRMGSDTVDLKTVEDHYNYGIRLINDRQLDEAAEHLRKALSLAKDPPAHVHYALAVVAALEQKPELSYEELEQAIEMDPLQRLIARRDPDLAGLAETPQIAELLAGDGSDGPSS